MFGEEISVLDAEHIFNNFQRGSFSSVSDSELVYSIVGDETTAGRIMKTAGRDITNLFRFSVSELIHVPGVGKKKAIAIVAAMELGRRRNANKCDKIFIRKSQDIMDLLRGRMADLVHEEVVIVLLSRSGSVLGTYDCFKGGVDSATVDTRIILKHAIEHLASDVVLVHNHPSGNNLPSEADNKITNSLKKACEAIGTRLLDHVIIAGSDYFSYKDSQLL